MRMPDASDAHTEVDGMTPKEVVNSNGGQLWQTPCQLLQGFSKR